MSKRIKYSHGFTLVELMVVIVIIGILVSIALPNFIGAQDRAKISTVKSNMHLFQNMAETYSIDWGGLNARTVEELYNEANQNEYNYWKDFTNPFLNSSGPGGSYTNETGTKQQGIISWDVSGSPIGGPVTTYYIYGYGSAAERIQLKGTDFYLTNS